MIKPRAMPRGFLHGLDSGLLPVPVLLRLQRGAE